jgi:hypothetical protein
LGVVGTPGAKNGETKTVPMTEELFAMFQRRRKNRDETPGDLEVSLRTMANTVFSDINETGSI